MNTFQQLLPLYLGCKCQVDLTTHIDSDGVGKNYKKNSVPCIFDGINRNVGNDKRWGVTVNDEVGFTWVNCFNKLCRNYTFFVKFYDIKLLLRPMRSLTDAEWGELANECGFDVDGYSLKLTFLSHDMRGWIITNNCLIKLRSMGVDCDGLFEKGHAIDTTLIIKP